MGSVGSWLARVGLVRPPVVLTVFNMLISLQWAESTSLSWNRSGTAGNSVLLTKYCDQGLMGMKVGGTRTLFVPAHLAYGERSMGAHIKPNSDLRFEIELLEVLTRDE